MTTETPSRRSRVAELAAEEAARAEAEEPETEEEEASEAETIPDPAPDETPDDEPEASLQARLSAFDAENERHLDALAEILGDDAAGFAPCPGCDAIGLRAVASMPYADDREQCPKCLGHGSLLTHSVNPATIQVECASCSGQGFVFKVELAPQQTTAGAPVPRFDPYTGELLPPSSQPNGGPGDAPWAPGYVPPARPAPTPLPG